MHALPILGLLLLSAVLGSQQCPAMNCDYPSLTWTGEVCGQPSGSGSSYTFNPTKCSNSTEYCQFTNFNSESVCVTTRVVPAYDAYPGEKCTEAHLCASGYCTEGVCTPFTNCQNYYDCDNMRYCNNGACTPLKNPGQVCYNDYECMQNAGCDTVAQGVQGICRNYLSLVPGTVVMSCNAAGLLSFGRNYMCESTYCYNFYGAYKCSESIQNAVQNFPQDCNAGSSCYTTVDGVSAVGASSQCQCGYNSQGQSYCPLYVGDKMPQKLSKEWKRWFNSDEIMSCNTFSRPSTNFWSWCLQSTKYHHYWDLQYYIQKTQFYSQTINSDKCYIKYVANQYYEADDKYDAAELLVLSVAFLGLV